MTAPAMWVVISDLKVASEGLFRSRRDQVILAGLIALAALVSAAELGASQLFSRVILPDERRSDGRFAGLVIAFFVVFGSLRVINYTRERYRITVFERALTESAHLNPLRDSWRWATAMELTGLLTLLARLGVVALALVAISPLLGVVNLVVFVAVVQALAVLTVRQFDAQRKFRALQQAKQAVTNAAKIRARIHSAEIGSLFAYAGILGVLGVLVWLTAIEAIPPGEAFVVFIAVRMMGQIYNASASSLMRYARARVLSE